MRYLVAVLPFLAAVAVSAQSPVTSQPADAAAPAFEVASVKVNKVGSGGVSLNSPPGRFTATNVPLRMLILQSKTRPTPLCYLHTKFEASSVLPVPL